MSSLVEHQEVLFELLTEFDRICRAHNIKYTLFAGTALGAIRHKGFIPWDDDVDVAMLREDYNKFLQIAPEEIDSQKYYIQAEYSEHWNMHFSKLRKNNTTCLEKYHPNDNLIHQGIYIDIFPCDNASDNSLFRKVQFLASRIVLAKNMSARGYETDSLLKKIFIVVCKMLPLKLSQNIAELKKHQDTKLVHTFFGGTSTYQKGIYPREWFEELMNTPFNGSNLLISKYYDELLKTMYGDYMKIPSEDERKCKVHAILVDVDKSYTEYSDYRKGMEFDIYTRSIR